MDVPQPAEEPYEVGDTVRVYLSEDDIDARYHDRICVVVADEPDELDDLTGREIDRHHYKLREVDSENELPISFRHSDLIPVEPEEETRSDRRKD